MSKRPAQLTAGEGYHCISGDSGQWSNQCEI